MALREVVGMERDSCAPWQTLMSLPQPVYVERWPNSLLPGNDIPSAYTVLPIAMETLGSMNDSADHFFEDLGRKIVKCLVTAVLMPVPPVIHQTRRSGPLAIPHLLVIFFFVFNPWTYTTRV